MMLPGSVRGPEVSVLIPAYNKERHIERAVRSVLNQSLDDLEVVITDDASTDRTPEIIGKLAESDSRIRIVTHTENRGTLISRLDAFQASSGRYLLCLDADDTLDRECAGTLLKTAKQTDSDLTGFGARLLDGSRNLGTVDAVKHTLTGNHIFETAFCRHLYNWSICLKLVRRELFELAAAESERFYCVSAEDFYFYTILSSHSKRLTMSGRIFYNYYAGEGITGEISPDSFRRYATMLDALQAIRRFLQKKGIWEKYADAFRDREREHFRLLLKRFPGSLETLAVMTEKYPAETVKQYLAEFYSEAYAEAAHAALEQNGPMPVRPEIKFVDENSCWMRKLGRFLLPPESWCWFLVKRNYDRFKWRKYS